MDRRERQIYNLELELLGRHFPGLKPRPVKLKKKMGDLEGVATEPNRQ